MPWQELCRTMRRSARQLSLAIPNFAGLQIRSCASVNLHHRPQRRQCVREGWSSLGISNLDEAMS